LLALGLHDLADFSLEVTGVAVPAAALLGTLAARTRADEGAAGAVSAPTGSWAFAAWGGIVAVAAIGIAAWTSSEGVRGDRANLAEACGAGGRAGAVECVDRAREAARRHPTDHVAFLSGGLAAQRTGDRGTAAAWLGRSVELCDGCVAPGTAYADVLLSSGDRDGAARIYQDLLDRYGDRLGLVVGHLVSLRVPARDMAALLRGHPDASAAVVRTLIAADRKVEAEGLLKAWLQAEGKLVEPLLSLGRLYLATGRVDGADRIATELLTGFPDAKEGYALQGQVESARGRLEQALAMTREARVRGPDDQTLILEEMTTLSGLGRFQEFDRASRTLNFAAVRREGLVMRYHRIVSARLEAAGRLAEALAELEVLDRQEPGDINVYLGYLDRGRILGKMGSWDRAVRLYREAVGRFPATPAISNALREAEKQCSH